MIYLASPYSGTLEQMQQRYLDTKHATATLLSNKHHIYSPIVHCHEMACRFSLPRDAQFWKEYNEDMIKRVDYLWLLKIPGWETSKGMGMEVEFASKIGKSIQSVIMDGTKLTLWNGGGELVCEYALIS